MNELQKEQIKKLRKQGLGYIKVAKALNLSENTVKSYCRRNNLSGEIAKKSNDIVEFSFCKCCGKELVKQKGKKERSFCDDGCRTSFWNKNQDKINRKTATEYICPICGNKFKDYARNNRKYCSRDCYITARYKGGGICE